MAGGGAFKKALGAEVATMRRERAWAGNGGRSGHGHRSGGGPRLNAVAATVAVLLAALAWAAGAGE